MKSLAGPRNMGEVRRRGKPELMTAFSWIGRVQSPPLALMAADVEIMRRYCTMDGDEMILNKMDLGPHVDFDPERAIADA